MRVIVRLSLPEVDNKRLIVASCWFSLSFHTWLTMHGYRNLKLYRTGYLAHYTANMPGVLTGYKANTTGVL